MAQYRLLNNMEQLILNGIYVGESNDIKTGYIYCKCLSDEIVEQLLD